MTTRELLYVKTTADTGRINAGIQSFPCHILDTIK